MSNDTTRLSAFADDTAAPNRTLIGHLSAYGRRARDALVYTSAYLVVIAMVEVATAMVALSLPWNLAPVVVGLLTFAVYTGDRLADADADEAEKPAQCAFMRRHERTLSVLSAGAYGLAITLSLLGGPLALAVTLLPGAFWVLYATDWLPTLGSRFKRLKDVLVVNSAIVALAWAVAVVCLPVAFADAAFTPTAAVVFVYFLLDTFVNTEIPNVRDRDEDEALGVSTLPVVFGVRRTRHILYGLDLLLVAFLGLAYLAGALSLALTVGTLVGLGYAFVLAALVGRTDDHARLSIAGEAKHLVVLAVVLGLTAAGI